MYPETSPGGRGMRLTKHKFSLWKGIFYEFCVQALLSKACRVRKEKVIIRRHREGGTPGILQFPGR